ncbi:MAG: class I adenylate-forming enzyme family protein [Acutalibacteraceae bacterium]|jgi:long-chain acyl-CoA synthetase
MSVTTAKPFERYMNADELAKLIEDESVSAMWARCAAAYADRPAIVDEGVSHTFGEVERDAARLRALLTPFAGKRVGLLAANSYDFVRGYLAAVTAGCTAVILPAQLDAGTVFGCSMKFGMDALIYQPGLEEKLAAVKARRPDLPLIAADAAGDECAPVVPVKPETPCVIMFTGGTTGQSKGALLSHRAVMQGTVNGCYGLKDFFFQRYLLAIPLSHVFGLIRNLMTALYTGSTLWICRSNKDMFRDIAVFKPTFLVVVPALAEMALTLSKKFGRNMLGEDMRYIICGAAAVAPYLVGEYDRMGIALCPGYGLTESANLVSGNPAYLSKPDSVGLPYPNQELKLVDGELWIKGKNVMDGYVGEEEPSFEDGWFRTGDLARFDEDGFLYITGRIKEIIVLPNGENVSPAEVEARFNALPCVQDSQVFAARSDAGGSILALEVVPRLTALKDLPPEQIKPYILERLAEVNRTLPGYQRVSRMTVRDTDFERTPSMKIVRYKDEQN